MDLSPRLYHWLIRSQWSTKKYIHDHIKNHFQLDNKIVLDFGSGTGANCCIFAPVIISALIRMKKRLSPPNACIPNIHFTVFDGNWIPMQNQMG